MDETPETVTIDADEYLELVEAGLMLDQLLSAGVDNWQGYDHIDRAAIRKGVAEAKAKLAEGGAAR